MCRWRIVHNNYGKAMVDIDLNMRQELNPFQPEGDRKSGWTEDKQSTTNP